MHSILTSERPIEAAGWCREADAPPASAAEPLALMLDEVDFGMLFLGADQHVRHLNKAARQALDGRHPLLLLGGLLRARHAGDIVPLHEAFAASQRGLRRWLALGEPTARVCVAVMPLGGVGMPGWVPAGAPGGRAPAGVGTLVMLGRSRPCEHLSMAGFARAHGLTAAESRVLAALCEGLPPRLIAQRHDVGLATVRTQISAIRAKTGASSIRAQLQQLAELPPMRSLVPC